MANWLKILKGYHQGKFYLYDYGLTPRMIIGASQEPIGEKFENETIAYETSKRIFDEMQFFNENGLIVTSNQCGIHNGPVLSLISSEWSSEKIGVTFEDIWTRYGDEIINGKFGISQHDSEVLEEIFAE